MYYHKNNSCGKQNFHPRFAWHEDGISNITLPIADHFLSNKNIKIIISFVGQ
jgi:hypothetical protein